MGDERYLYFDTSALAKWYINEAHSQDVGKCIRGFTVTMF
jgi:predicted nucleic acid-binding protein